jgi:hypothetical protein
MTAEIGQRIILTAPAFTYADETNLVISNPAGSVDACGAIVYELVDAAASVSYVTFSSPTPSETPVITLYSILTSDLMNNTQRKIRAWATKYKDLTTIEYEIEKAFEVSITPITCDVASLTYTVDQATYNNIPGHAASTTVDTAYWRIEANSGGTPFEHILPF